MDASLKSRFRQKLYHNSEMACLNAPSLPLTEAAVEYFQESFPGDERLGRLDMPMASTVCKRNSVSPCSVVLSMLYAKRLRQRSRTYLQAMSSTDVFFISMMMASKYLCDEGVEEEVYNDEWAGSVGQEVEEVNQMEMDFLKEMDWQLYVKQEEFDKALTAIERKLALREGLRRGWFTYTELDILMDWDPVCQVWNQVGLDCTKMVSLFSAAYLASLVSMMGSAALALQLSGPMATATLAVLSLHPFCFSGNIPTSIHLAVTSPMQNGVPVEDVNLTSAASGLSSTVTSILNSEELMADGIQENRSDVDGEGRSLENKFKSNEAAEIDFSQDAIETDQKAKVKQASVFSLWFFDSLLSQMWSLVRLQQTSIASDGSDSYSAPTKSWAPSTGKTENIHDERMHCSKCKKVHCQKLKSQTQLQIPDNFHPSCVVALDHPILSDRLDQSKETSFGEEADYRGLESFQLKGRLPSRTLNDPFDSREFPFTLRHHSRLAKGRPWKENFFHHCHECPTSASSGVSWNRCRCVTSQVLPSNWNAGVDLTLVSLVDAMPILGSIGFFTDTPGPLPDLST